MIKVIIDCLSQKQTDCGAGSKFITARRTSHARPRSHARATNVTGPLPVAANDGFFCNRCRLGLNCN